MIVLKYQKTGSVCFISHIDLLRHMERVLRRGQIEVKFSQGFNPHPLMFFSPPLSLGVSSRAEYLSIDSDMDENDVLARYNASVPDTLKASKAFKCEKNPNLQAKVVWADYVFPTEYRDLKLDDFEIEYVKKGESVKENVANKIYGTFNIDGKLGLRLASGNSNLRPDRVLPKLNELLGTDMRLLDVVKVAQYVDDNGTLVDVDGFLQR